MIGLPLVRSPAWALKRWVSSAIEVTIVRDVIRVKSVRSHAEGDDVGYERADYFSFDSRTALGLVLVYLRITEIDDNSIACTSRTNPPKRCTVAATPGVRIDERKKAKKAGPVSPPAQAKAAACRSGLRQKADPAKVKSFAGDPLLGLSHQPHRGAWAARKALQILQPSKKTEMAFLTATLRKSKR